MKSTLFLASLCGALLSASPSARTTPPGPAAPTVAQALEPISADAMSRPFLLFDADNRVMGRMWTTNLAEVTVNGHRYVTSLVPALQADGNVSPVLLDYTLTDWFFFYVSADCQGQAYSRSGGADMPFGIVEESELGTLIFYPLGSMNHSTKVRSFYSFFRGCFVIDPPEVMPLVSVGDPVDISLSYRRPFHVR
jgi:hypothetical protein